MECRHATCHQFPTVAVIACAEAACWTMRGSVRLTSCYYHHSRRLPLPSLEEAFGTQTDTWHVLNRDEIVVIAVHAVLGKDIIHGGELAMYVLLESATWSVMVLWRTGNTSCDRRGAGRYHRRIDCSTWRQRGQLSRRDSWHCCLPSMIPEMTGASCLPRLWLTAGRVRRG